ncbi:hypothetical protein CRUP_014799 [Coryphaenoides rupestris]|nr:hypothetical protein CRUP_014799 [Coryphaenoides rupestris]
MLVLMMMMMRRSFSHSSLSCLMDARLGSEDPHDPCWQLTQQLQYRIEKTMAERLQKDMFVLKKSSRSTRGYLGERVGSWEAHRGPAFLQDMELRGWDLLVPRAGLYFIYAQTYFRLPSAGGGGGGGRGRGGGGAGPPACLPAPGGHRHLQPADRLFITVRQRQHRGRRKPVRRLKWREGMWREPRPGSWESAVPDTLLCSIPALSSSSSTPPLGRFKRRDEFAPCYTIRMWKHDEGCGHGGVGRRRGDVEQVGVAVGMAVGVGVAVEWRRPWAVMLVRLMPSVRRVCSSAFSGTANASSFFSPLAM